MTCSVLRTSMHCVLSTASAPFTVKNRRPKLRCTPFWQLAELLRAKACAIVSPESTNVTPEWIERLLRPVYRDDFDLVTPLYRRHKFDGLLLRNLVYPMTRALYARRVRDWPTGRGSIITARPPFMSEAPSPAHPAVLEPPRQVVLRRNRVEMAGEEDERLAAPPGVDERLAVREDLLEGHLRRRRSRTAPPRSATPTGCSRARARSRRAWGSGLERA